jgi:phosphoglycolate phosphatase
MAEQQERYLEIRRQDLPRGGFRAALVDFDGTVSLIRQGWQDVMVPYFTEELAAACREVGAPVDEQEVASYVRDFVDELTGKQTIYQCIRLAEEIEKRGGKPKEPLEYKREYHDRLLRRIGHRIAGLKAGTIPPAEMLLPGAVEFLSGLRRRGVVLYLASGTDETYVLDEAACLGVTDLFDGGIYGAQDQYQLFSKALVIQRILSEHRLSGPQLLGIGDGFVEIENVKAVDGVAIGVASDEVRPGKLDSWKRERLIRAGADIIVPAFQHADVLLNTLFPDS